MTILEKTKHCSKRFPCRFRVSLLLASIVILVTVITVPLLHS